MTTRRCFWVPVNNPVYAAYHDDEWGFPEADDHRLFEKLSLESFQAGLSWWTILRKRNAFREAFENFDFERVAGFGSTEVERLVGNTGIVRHRAKIEATISNARTACRLANEEGSLSSYVWRFQPDASTRPPEMTEQALRLISSSPQSVALSRDLKKRGWRFFGPTTAYAFMQAAGLVNDHTHDCVVRPRAVAARAAFTPPV